MGTKDRDDLAHHFEIIPGVLKVPAPRQLKRRVIDVRQDGKARTGQEDPALAPYLTGRPLSTTADIQAARVLHAQEYVRLGWLPAAAVGEDGGLRDDVDPWGSSAEWFGSVRADKVHAVARMLKADDLTRLPTFRLAGLALGERRTLLQIPASSVVEISALVRSRDAAVTDSPAVMASLWRESLRRGHEAWVMAVDVAVFEMLRRRVSGTAIRAIGSEQTYLGSPVVPAVLRFEDLAPAQLELAERYAGPDPLPALLPRLFAAAPGVRR